MNLRMILAREFRVLCRRRSGYAARIVLIGMVTVTWALLFAIGVHPSENLLGMSAMAQILLCFGAAVALSDTVGSERRNRTLGLLLLTPLRPWEVLLGKLFTGISWFLLCLAAILPVLALPLLEGEVTLPDVIRQFVGILGITFLGMITGLFASVIGRQAASSAGIAIALLLLLYLGPLLVAVLLDIADMLPSGGFFWIGPFFLTGLDYPQFGSWFLNMGILAFICLALLLLSLVLFRLVWNRERRFRTPGKRSTRNRRAPPPIRDGSNPYRALRRRFHSVRFYRIQTGLLLLCSIAFGLSSYDGGMDYYRLLICYILGLALHVLAYWRICLNATRLLHEERRCGILEPVLTSPLHSRSIRAGFGCQPGFYWTLILFLCWNLALFLGSARFSPPSDFQKFFHWIHLPLLVPLELFAIRAAGLWWSWHSGKPLRATLVLFLVHAVLSVPLFGVGALLLEAINWPSGSVLANAPVLCISLWALIRWSLALTLLLWGHVNNRYNMVRLRGGPMTG